MPAVITTCGKCGTQFQWNSDFQEMPDCPRCGYNPNQKYQQSDISGLAKMLQTGDRYDSSGAAAELGKRGDRRAIEPLIAALKNPDARLAAVIALGKIPDERAIEPLINILTNGEGPSGSAAEALIRIGTPHAIQAVAERIESVDARSYRDVFGAFKSKGEVIIPVLVPMLKSGSNHVRDYAAIVLKDLGWMPEGLGLDEQIKLCIEVENWDKLKQVGQAAVDKLRTALIGESGWGISKINIAKALDKLGWKPEREYERIIFLMTTNKSNELVQAGASVVEPLIAALNDSVWWVRTIAHKYLGAIKDARAVQPLIMALKNEELKCEAVQALGAIGDPRAISPLVEILKPPVANSLADFVSEALAAIGAPAHEALFSLLKNDESNVRHSAIRALGAIKCSEAVDHLIPMINDNHEGGYRWSIARALGEIGDRRAIEPLKAILKDKDQDVREKAKEALAKIQKLDKPATVKSSPTGKQQAEKKACFIATACYGSEHSPEVVSLRNFRDSFLLRHSSGRLFVRLYYLFSPPAAEVISRHHQLRALIRATLIAPLVRVVSFLYKNA